MTEVVMCKTNTTYMMLSLVRMKKNKTKKGFSYHIDKEVLKDYQGKPIELRLKWLYMGNLLRMGYSKNIIKIQDKFREGE